MAARGRGFRGSRQSRCTGRETPLSQRIAKFSTGCGLLGRGGAALEELVAKRTVGAKALAGGAGEDASPTASWAGLLALRVGHRLGKRHDRRRLDRLGNRQGLAHGGFGDGRRWRLKRCCCCGGGVSLIALPE